MPTASKVSYADMAQQACQTLGVRGKYVSRAQIKSFMVKNFNYVDTSIAKNALRKALQQFERKGDSFRITEQMRSKKATAEKSAALKAKALLKKTQATEKATFKKTALRARKVAALEKVKAKRAALKKRAMEKAAALKAKKAITKAKNAARKSTKKKTSKKQGVKKPIKK